MKKCIFLVLVTAMMSLAFAPASRAETSLAIIAPGLFIVIGGESDIFFSNGYYWRKYRGHWERTDHYGGHWEEYHDRLPFREPTNQVVRDRKAHGERYRESDVRAGRVEHQGEGDRKGGDKRTHEGDH